MDTTSKRASRLVIVLLGAVIAAIVAWILFVVGPDGNLAMLLGVLLVVIASLMGARTASNVAERLVAPYNVAEVPVEGPITRRDGGRMPSRPNVTSADEVVDQIEQAGSDDNVEGLVVRLNTPGGEVVPSEDIRIAVEQFDGPTVAYAQDTCASGGYWIASGCDTIVGREGTIVGSIGVLASRITAEDLLDTIGLTYERLVAGEYKDTGVPFRDMDQDDRAYLQEIVDEYYDVFIDRVAEGRDLDADIGRPGLGDRNQQV
ncbi:MAG: S49 family peptidase, partial [Halodesulfurarchaeum sp.]